MAALTSWGQQGSVIQITCYWLDSVSAVSEIPMTAKRVGIYAGIKFN